MTVGTKDGRDFIGESLNGCAAALRFADHLDDLREQRFAADALGAHEQRAGAVHGRADDASTGLLLNGNRFAGDHRFIDGAGTFDDAAIDGNLFAGTNAKFLSDLHVGERDIGFGAVVGDDARHLGRKIEQGANSAGRAAASAKFHDLTDEDEDGDAGGGFEVNAGLSVRAAQ